MSKPHVIPKSVTNELTGASSFFKSNATPIPEAAPAPTSERSFNQADSALEESRTAVRPVRPLKRQMIRHPFELYMDQLERLRDAAQTERQQGGAGSMSKMVREAIDRFLDELPPATP